MHALHDQSGDAIWLQEDTIRIMHLIYQRGDQEQTTLCIHGAEGFVHSSGWIFKALTSLCHVQADEV